MEIRWLRGGEKIPFNRPSTWFALGVRGSGKSSFLESIACRYLEAGSAVLDLFASRDGENLAWLRSPYKDRKILLLRGEAVDVSASYDVKPASSVTLEDFERYDVIVSSPPFYSNFDDELTQVATLTDKIYRRLHWQRLIFAVIREASNFLYSRLKLTANQDLAKVQSVYLLREARHCGLALGLDSIRFQAIDINIRDLSDYLVLKSQGLGGLSDDLRFLYSYFEPAYIRNHPPQFFFIVSRFGSVGVGEFEELSWHKRPKEDILKELGIRVEYGEIPEEGQYRGTFKTVGDREHAEIIALYQEQGLSMKEVSAKMGRSSGTAHGQIRRHNQAVERTGFCPVCKRVGSSHQNELVIREAV